MKIGVKANITEVQKEAYDTYQKLGSYSAAAKSLGKSVTAVRTLVTKFNNAYKMEKDVNFSHRAVNCLKSVGIENLKALENVEVASLYRITNLGKKSINEIIYECKKNNVSIIDDYHFAKYERVPELASENPKLYNKYIMLKDELKAAGYCLVIKKRF